MVEENFSNGTGACCTNHMSACVMPPFSFSLVDTFGYCKLPKYRTNKTVHKTLLKIFLIAIQLYFLFLLSLHEN